MGPFVIQSPFHPRHLSPKIWIDVTSKKGITKEMKAVKLIRYNESESLHKRIYYKYTWHTIWLNKESTFIIKFHKKIILLIYRFRETGVYWILFSIKPNIFAYYFSSLPLSWLWIAVFTRTVWLGGISRFNLYLYIKLVTSNHLMDGQYSLYLASGCRAQISHPYVHRELITIK